MTPGEVIELIKRSNEEFCRAHESGYFESFRESQSPLVTLLTCSDSRVHSSAFLKNPDNTVFSVENIGNQVANSEGSIDYGIYHLQTPVLLIAGHSDCGAIKAYCAGYDSEPPSIRKELDSLRHALRDAGKASALPERVSANVRYQAAAAAIKYSDLILDGKLAVVGGYYDFANDFQEGFGKLKIVSINGR